MKAILFDYGGTLDSDGIVWKDRFYGIYKKNGLQIGQEKFDRAFYDSDDNLHLRYKLAGLSLSETVRLQVRDVFTNLSLTDTALADKIAEDFVAGSRENFVLVRPVLKRLAAKYRLGIVSNFYGNIDSVLKSEDMLKYFSCVADSTAVGSNKPDAGIFMHVLDNFGMKPAEAAMVGDSYKRDIVGAQNIGIKQVYIMGSRFDTDEKPAPRPDLAVIKNFAQLEHAVESLTEVKA